MLDALQERCLRGSSLPSPDLLPTKERRAAVWGSTSAPRACGAGKAGGKVSPPPIRKQCVSGTQRATCEGAASERPKADPAAASRKQTCDLPSPSRAPPVSFRQRTSFWVQAGALARKQACFQKRRWLSNGVLLAAPFLICMLLWVLQNVINQQLNSRAFRCGCKCLSCCDWVAVQADGGGGSTAATNATYLCYQASDERPCSPYAKCQVGGAGGGGLECLLRRRGSVGFLPCQNLLLTVR